MGSNPSTAYFHIMVHQPSASWSKLLSLKFKVHSQLFIEKIHTYMLHICLQHFICESLIECFWFRLQFLRVGCHRYIYWLKWALCWLIKYARHNYKEGYFLCIVLFSAFVVMFVFAFSHCRLSPLKYYEPLTHLAIKLLSRINLPFQAVGGNIITACPISDLNPLLQAAGCTLTVISLGKSKACGMWHLFHNGNVV